MPRRNLSIKERLKIIENKENNYCKVEELCSEFKVSPWTVRRILKNHEALKEAAENGQMKKTRLEKRPELIEFDGKIKDWINGCALKGIPLTATMIVEYAKELSAKLTDYETKGSWGWFLSFKKRINLKLGVTHGERLSVDLTIVKQWKEIEIPRIMLDWQSEFIYNCDETALFWRQAPIKTYFISKHDHLGDKLFHERISILFTVSRNGDKMKPLVINRSAKPRCFYSNCLSDLDVQYTVQQNAWMDREIFWNWLATIHDDLMQKDKKIVLILDNFSGHKVNYSDSPLITFKFLPPGTTSLTQPLDAGIIKSFKSKYLSIFMKRVLQDVNSSHISDVVKKINLLDALRWVDIAWKSISNETIINCWDHFGYTKPIINNFEPNNDKEICDLLCALKNLSINVCSYDDLVDQNNFDFVNYFED